jgi:sporulation protein YlmC with PRC-barrel domain
MLNKSLLFLCFWIGSAKATIAQNITPSVINAAGTSQAQVGNVWLEIAVGEVVTSTVGNITQGVLQPRYTLATPTIELAEGRRIHIFPNPTTDELNIEATKTIVTQLHVLDMSGRLVLVEKSHPLSINVQNLAAGSYILQIFTANAALPVATSFIKN